MHSVRRIEVALAASLLLCSGCAGFGGKSSPAAGANGVVYNPPVPISQVPTGESRPEPPTGWARYSFDNIGETFRSATGRGPNEAIARKLYAEGDDLYRQKKYDAAAVKYRAAADRLEDSTLEEDGLFMEGEAFFFANEYNKAEDAYEQLAKKYSNTRHINIVVARQFAIAVYWQQYDRFEPHFALTPNFFDSKRPMFDTWGNALRAFDQVRLNDPRGPLADEAVMQVANDNFLRGRWDDADYNYKLVRTEYPKSKHQLEAHVLGIQAKLRMYQGPGYDDRPLKGAEQLIDQTLVQFGHELPAEEQTRLVTAKGEIHAQQAMRNYQVAQFYEKGEHYAAARVYYAEIVKQYPQTKLAEEAKSRLVALQPLPDNPPDKFKVLKDVFDGPDKIDVAIAQAQKNAAGDDGSGSAAGNVQVASGNSQSSSNK